MAASVLVAADRGRIVCHPADGVCLTSFRAFARDAAKPMGMVASDVLDNSRRLAGRRVVRTGTVRHGALGLAGAHPALVGNP